MQAQIRPLFFSQTTSIFENSGLGPLNWNIHHCFRNNLLLNYTANKIDYFILTQIVDFVGLIPHIL